MSFTSWLRKRTSTDRPPTRSQRQVRCRLGLEPLEDRCLLSYTPIDLGVFSGAGWGTSGAAAINEKHQVVGSSASPGPYYRSHGFLWDNGRLTDLGTLGGSNSSALDINEAGQVAGWAQTAAGEQHAFRWENGVMTDLGIATQNSPEFEQPVVALNNAGTVVGYTYNQSGHNSFVWEDGVVLDLAALLPANSGWSQLHATGVNDAGQIVGGGTWNGQKFPFLYLDSDGDGKFATGGGQIVSLLTKGSNLTLATAINRSGQVTGFSLGSNGVSGFLWTPSQANGASGTSKNLGSLSGKYYGSSRAFGLNDAGDVVGKAYGDASNAVIWPGGGQVMDLDATPGAYPSPQTANAISNDGWIVGSGYFSLDFSDAFLLIPGADSVPLLSISDVYVDEGDAGITTAAFTVTLSRPISEAVTVDYSTASGQFSSPATPGVDYVAVSGTLTFLPGETNKTIAVPVIGDTLPEYGETFVVDLSNPTNALCGDSRGKGNISGADGRLWINNVTLAEGNSGTTAFDFTVTLTKAASVSIDVGFTTIDGSAKAGSDYVSTSGLLTFAPGETTKTITVLVVGDTVYEPDETFYVRLSSTSSYPNYALFTNFPQGTGTIRNDDPDPNPKPGGGKKLTAASIASDPVTSVLSPEDAQALLDEALIRWAAAGVDTSVLHGLQVRIADLGGNTLGQVKGNTIWLDDNAAGWGWFVDRTPWEDSEFSTAGDQGEQNHMDLLTALQHEIGHLLGYDHVANGLMDPTLLAGTRKSI